MAHLHLVANFVRSARDRGKKRKAQSQSRSETNLAGKKTVFVI
jgi:hypothetical protein